MSGTPIGEILLLQEAIDPFDLTAAIQEQAATGMRLVSLLISRALIDPDEGALALSEQHDVPGAMQRHLERRDPGVLNAIPAELVRRWVVLPLGRSSRGKLVVVARDPTPILTASLEHVTGGSIELSVTPAVQLERLVRSLYGELDVVEPVEPVASPAPRRAFDELDLSTADQPRRPPRSLSRVMFDTAPALPSRKSHSITQELDGTLQQIERAVSRSAADQHAVAFAGRRWGAVLLLTIGDGAMLGRRGSGPRLDAPEAIIFPLMSPSVAQVAYRERTPTQQAPSGPMQRRIAILLGTEESPAAAPAAAPIIVNDRVEAVLVVGDPTSDLRAPLVKLAALADALGAAYQRLAGG